MFSEKNLPRLIIYTPIIAIVFLTSFTIYLFVETQNEYFQEESILIEKQFKRQQKKLIREQIKSTLSFITHQEQVYTNQAMEKVIKRTFTLSSRLKQLNMDLNLEVNRSKQKKILTSLINANEEEDNYFFAYDINDSSIIQAKNQNIKLEFKKDDKFFENYLYSEEGKLISFKYSNKIVYIKCLQEENWIIGNIENIKKDIDFIKKISLSYISQIKFDNEAYIWIYDKNSKLLTNERSEHKVNTNNQQIIDTFVKKALNDEKGFFTNYSWLSSQRNKLDNKIAYVQLFEKWNWIVGASLYLDDIKESVKTNKKNLEIKVEKYVQYIIIVSLLIMFVISALSILMSNQVSKVFKIYQNNVKRKEIKLKNLNASLKEKVKIGIQEAQKKDRAMLHQSRLARLGTMISMIAHQWRQPLSEVSGILMELETATKFKKVDDKLILECIKESDKLLIYMSNTIDDFRNFFKPSKEKVDFSLIEACENAISIVNASLNDLDIVINKDFKEDITICSFPREFSQVILNLLLNCKDVFEDRKTENPYIDFKIQIIDNEVYITIEDNAGGISENNIDIIFEPYFTTKSSLKGTGLGLYMSNMIIEKNMHGKLNVTNSPKGAVFEIILEVKNG